jgi:acid phosphatase
MVIGEARGFMANTIPASVRAITLVALLVPAAGCTGGPNLSGDTNTACRALTVSSARRSSSWSGTVFTIVMENHSRSQILGSSDAPYINHLAAQGAVAYGYHGPYIHPSEPNYLWMVAGENFAVVDDTDPGPARTLGARGHVADQIEHAGLTWKAYEEGMGAPCGLASNGTYAARHDPFVFFDDINGWNGSQFAPSARCIEHVVDYSRLDADIAADALPSYVFITPDLEDDMHDGTVGDADAWLSREVPKILATDAFQKGGVLFLLWDEGQNDGDDPPFIALSPNGKAGYTSYADYDTSSYLLTVERLLGVDDLPCGAQPEAVQPMADLFKVPLPSKAAPTPRSPRSSAPASDAGIGEGGQAG